MPVQSDASILGVLQNLDRASMVDVATELTRYFGGAKGIAKLIFELFFDPKSTPALKSRIMRDITRFLGEVSKQQGDLDSVGQMTVEEIEREIVALVGKHGQIPINGSAYKISKEEVAGAAGVPGPG
jgi:hypothetical protein